MSNTSNFSLTTQQIWSSISSDLTGLATQTSNLFGGFLSKWNLFLQLNRGKICVAIFLPPANGASLDSYMLTTKLISTLKQWLTKIWLLTI